MLDHLPAAVVVLDAASSLGVVAGRLLLGAIIDIVTAVVMAILMRWQGDGFILAYIAAAVVRRTTSGEMSFGDASIVYHAAGAFVGVLYAVVYLVTDAAAPDLGVAGTDIDLPSYLVMAAVIVAFIYVAFARFTFPRAGRRIHEGRTITTCGQWLCSSSVLGATLSVLALAIFPGFA